MQDLSSKELAEWQAYERVEPFGERRMDIRFAMLAMTISNIWRGKNQPPFKLEQFMPDFEPPKQQSWKEQYNIMKAWTQAQKQNEDVKKSSLPITPPQKDTL